MSQLQHAQSPCKAQNQSAHKWHLLHSIASYNVQVLSATCTLEAPCPRHKQLYHAHCDPDCKL